MPISLIPSLKFPSKLIFRIIIALSLILILALPLFSILKTTRAAKQNGQGEPVLTGERRATPTGYRSVTGKHKIRVTDSQQARELKRLGATLVADYGSFQIFKAEEAVVQSMSKASPLTFNDEDNLVLLNVGALDTTKTELQQQRGRAANLSVGEPSLHLVQFAGPIKPNWVEELRATGVKIVNYIPNNAYLVFGHEANLAKLSEWAASADYVQWDGEYKSQYKIDPTTASQMRGNLGQQENEQLFAVQLIDDGEGNQITFNTINGLKTDAIRSQYTLQKFVNVIVKLPVLSVERQLAERPDVISIARYVVPEKFDERQNVIMTGNLTGNSPTPSDYLTFLSNQGFNQTQFNTSGFAVNVVDSGIDNATTSPNHFALYVSGLTNNASRVMFNRLEGTPNGVGSTLLGCDGHGNLNAHIIGGFIPSGAPFDAFPHADDSGFRYGLGVAPFVRVGSTVIFDPNTYTFPNLTAIESRAYNDNARISSNSWGASLGGAYNIDSQTYDALVRDSQPTGAPFTQAGNQEMVIVFSAGNQGPSSTSIGAPGTAKNVITVGAAENAQQAFGAADGCNIADSGADNANDIISFSSRGPTTDGRRKPEIVAPGTHITGGVAQASNPSSTGTANPCYTGGGVCGGPSGADYFPSGQQFYTASSGTSHSAPAVAGAAALVRQRFINASLTPPTPAMTKAVLMNSARYMTGSGANDTLWSNVQGMGEVNLTTAMNLFSAPAVLRDQSSGDTLTASGQSRTYTGNVSNSGQPFRVTLAWTDAPGSTTGNSFVNNLDLEVTVGGQTYKGNVFSGASSVTGGSADTRNNAESVFIPAGVTGTFTVRVLASNIAGDGVPNFGGALDQDFALVISNATLNPLPVVAPASKTITAESCGTGNGEVDPGETVTVDLALQNVGTADTSNLVATLQASGGVLSPSGAQNYGAMVAGGATVTRPFTFTASGTCGGTVTATLDLQDGATNLGTVTFTFRLGATVSGMSSFSNTGSISIPNGAPGSTSGNALPYPSQVTASGLNGTVTKVTVTLNGLNHTFPDDIDMLLVGPDGQSVLLMSDAGGSTDIVNSNITFDDTAAAIPDSSAVTTGTYAPADYGGITDTFASPAPVAPYGTSLSVFNGTSGNGVWSLYIVDDADTESGSMTGGWTLNITTGIPACCSPMCPTITIAPPTLSNAQQGVFYTQTFTQTGGTAPVVFGLTGTMPPGLVFSGAMLSGTPTTPGTFNFAVAVVDTNGCTVSTNYSLVVTCPVITVNPASLPNGIVGRNYSQQLSQSGGTAPITFTRTLGTLPAGLTLSTGGLLSGVPSTPGSFTFTVEAKDVNNCTGTREYTVTVTRLQFYPLAAPIRLLDTRVGESGCDAPGAKIPGGTSRTQTARRTCAGQTIPANAMAITGNVTTVDSGGGFLTLYPSDVATIPFVSNTNYTPNEVINNVFTVGLGEPDGAFKIFVTSNTDVVVDVTGYYAPPGTGGLYFHPLPKPVRLLETRAGEPGCNTPGATIPANTDITQTAPLTCDGVTIPANASAIVGNATVVNNVSGGFLTLFPANVTRPLVANSNFTPGQVMNGPFTVGLSPSGQFKFYSTTVTDLVIDVLGYYSPDATDINGAGLLYTGLQRPVRLLETRSGETGCTAPGVPILAGGTLTQAARGTCDGMVVASNAAAVVGNATVVNTVGPGHLTFWPSSATQPTTAMSNYVFNQILNRHFIVGLGAGDGAFKVFSFATTDLVIDLSGYFAP
jgi:subtilisin-like proprotein convertase family protein